MNKTEFLDQLRMSLNGKIDAEEVMDNLRYYEDYINGQLRLGKSEHEVMATLGSPRLIARTITDTQADSAQEATYEEYAQDRQTGTDNGYQGRAGMQWILKFFSLPRWLKTTISVAILILVVAIFVAILQFLLPVLLLAAITLFLVKLFRDWLH